MKTGWKGTLIGMGDDMRVVLMTGRGGVGDLNTPLKLQRLCGLCFLEPLELDLDLSVFLSKVGNALNN